MEVYEGGRQGVFRRSLMMAILICSGVIAASAKELRLPDAVRADLNRQAGNWRLVAVRASGVGKCASVVTGDFDGNGQTDYAVYIVAGKGPVEKRQRLILYLKSGEQYSRRMLSQKHPNDDYVYLCLFRKGTEDYRYDTGKHFRYTYDTVGLFSEKAGESYLYRKGRFYPVITSD